MSKESSKSRVRKNPLKEQKTSGVSQVIGKSHNQNEIRSFKERVKATGLQVNWVEAIQTVREKILS